MVRYLYSFSIFFIYFFECKAYFKKRKLIMTSYGSTLIRCERQSENPQDTVQQIIWDPTDRSGQTFLTAGWDGFARVYSIQDATSSSKRLEKRWEFFFGHPVLSVDVTRDNLLFAGLVTGDIALVDMKNTQNCVIMGAHNAPIVLVAWVQKFGVLITLAFDNLIKVFSLQQNQGNYQIAEYKLPSKTNVASFCYPYLLIGAQDARVAILRVEDFDKVNFENQYQQLCHSQHGIVKYSCCSISDYKKFVLGTPDGRLIVSGFSEYNNGIKLDNPIVSKYQKVSHYRRQCLGQMNGVSMGYRDKKQFCIFGGSEQTCTYNLDKNNKVKSYSSSTSTACTAVSVSPGGDYFAWAIGNDWAKGLDELLSVRSPKIQVSKISITDISTTSYMR